MDRAGLSASTFFSANNVNKPSRLSFSRPASPNKVLCLFLGPFETFSFHYGNQLKEMKRKRFIAAAKSITAFARTLFNNSRRVSRNQRLSTHFNDDGITISNLMKIYHLTNEVEKRKVLHSHLIGGSLTIMMEVLEFSVSPTT